MEFRAHRIRRLDFTFHSAASGARAGSRSWCVGSAIFDHARRDQQAQSHLVIESQRRHDGCAVEGATGVCYSIWLGAWRSLVAHLPWEQGVGRSNRLAPTRASSSGGKSNGLLSRGSGVRIPSGAPSSLPGIAIAAGQALITKRTVVSVAQLAEHRVVAPAVEGSSPFTHPTKSC